MNAQPSTAIVAGSGVSPARRSAIDVSALRQTGVVAIIIGVLALLFPFATSIGVGLATGVLLVVLGLSEGVRALRTRRSGNVTMTALFGGVALVTGTLMLAFPTAGVATMAIWLIAFFVVGGCVRVAMSLQLRGARGWWWLFGSGVLSVLLGAGLWMALPGAAYWAVGAVFGVDALLFGAALFALAGRLRRRHLDDVPGYEAEPPRRRGERRPGG